MSLFCAEGDMGNVVYLGGRRHTILDELRENVIHDLFYNNRGDFVYRFCARILLATLHFSIRCEKPVIIRFATEGLRNRQ